MSFSDLFIVGRRKKAEKGAAVAAAAEGSSEGVFLSAKSLLSFPVATATVTFIWKLCQHYWNVGDIWVLYISLAVGGLIFLIVISEKSARPTGIGWIVSVVLAFVNSLFLAASALGLVKNILAGNS